MNASTRTFFALLIVMAVSQMVVFPGIPMWVAAAWIICVSVFADRVSRWIKEGQ